jgi:tartrate dehydrogenase/decarboxylase/D-malate dehydrogenase
MRVLEVAGQRFGLAFAWREFDWSCERYLVDHKFMPEGGMDELAGTEVIFLGAVGHPSVPDHLSLWELLIPIRRSFRQYVNLRPIRSLAGIDGPLATGVADHVDIMVVRENNEGEYSEVGGRVYRGTDQEMAIQESVFTRTGISKVATYAFELASSRALDLVSATKSNGIIHTMPFWDEVTAQIGEGYPAVRLRSILIDALAAALVLKPHTFDVIVASNLFGDILTDLGAAVVGGIGIAPSANLNPERDHPSMFEAIHGSAPDIAGQGIANPIGQIWSGAMMLDHVGEQEAAAAVLAAVETAIADPEARTPDLGGRATTQDMTQAVIEALRS